MPNKVIITSDSTTDLSRALLDRYAIRLMPLTVTLGGQSYRDGVDITADEIYEHYRQSGELPKTSATNLADCENFFSQLTAEGYDVVHFTLSSEMSSNYQNFCIAAGGFDNVFVVDTKNLSTGGGLLVLKAAELAESGMDAAAIAEQTQALADRVDASFVIDSLEFLYKGGRCSALSALGANLLKLKPCIVVRNGKMGVARKYRGKFEMVLEQYIRDQLADPGVIDGDCIFVTHAGCDEALVERCVALVKELVPGKEVYTTRAGCTISSHCGQNTLGVLFIRIEPLTDA